MQEHMVTPLVETCSSKSWVGLKLELLEARAEIHRESGTSLSPAAASEQDFYVDHELKLWKGSGEAPAAAPGPSEEPPWASEIVKKVQDFFREQDKDQEGFVTRSDMKKLQEEDFPCSMEELELVFDGLDAAGTGRLSTEEFTAGLCKCRDAASKQPGLILDTALVLSQGGTETLPRQFLNSQKAARDHRRRKTASRRVRLVLPSPTLEGADSEERRHFAAFMDQLGTDNISEEQEIWQLWVKLRQDEPQLLGNLEDFLAKMRHRIQEARSKKEALEVTLNKRVAEHDKDVQQLCEALEQQIEQEQQRLHVARSHQHSVELQRALDASEREVQRLVTAQMELEMRCRSLRSTQQAASTENRQLEESNRVLEDRLQHLHQQLQQTHRRLQTARAATVWEHMEESGDRAGAELPGETPLSPQMSPGKSEKHLLEMQIGLRSQSSEPKAKSIHQVVWEMPPAEINLLGPPPRASSEEEDPFPEFLKEEHFSDQSSLLREMNDAIAALSKQLKPQAPSVPPDAAHHPQDDAEPQMGPEAAAAHGTTPGVLQETLPGHIGHKLVEGDLKEGPATAELRAPDVTQAGAAVGAGHHRAQEPGAEQGESPEEARRMLFLQGKGAGVKELMLKAAEHPQGAPGESTEAGEQALMEVEGEGWMQEKTGWEKAQPPGEAEEAALRQGENLEAGLGPPEAGDTGLAAGWQLATGEPGPAAVPGGCPQPLGAGLGEEADPPWGLSEELEIKPGECLEPEPPSRGEARMGAAQGDGDSHPEVTVAPGPTVLEEEHIVRAQALELVESEDFEADVQLCGGASLETPQGGGDNAVTQLVEDSEEGAQGQNERELTQELVLHPHGVTIGPGAGAGAGVQPREEAESLGVLEEQSTAAMAEVDELKLTPGGSTEAHLQLSSDVTSPGTEQGGTLDPDVEPLDQVDKPELVEMVEAEDFQADRQLCEHPSQGTPQGGEDNAATQRGDEDEDGAQGQGERELPHEPVLDPQGTGIGQGAGADAGVQPWEEAESLGVLEEQSTAADVQLMVEVDERKLTPGGSTEAVLQPLSAAGSPGTGHGASMDPDAEPLDQVDELELVEMEAEDTQLCEHLSQETLQEWGDNAVTKLMEDSEEGAQGHAKLVLYPERPAAAEGPGVEAKLGALTGPDEQILEDTQPLDLPQGERAAVEGRPLDGAQGLEVVQGEMLEEGARSLVEAQSLGLKQGHDDGASALASPVSEVPLQISTLKLETMMQEDVLVPDVRRLGASGQAAQSELQEQVSAQAVKVRLHTASQPPEDKPPHVMETEQVAAGPSEPPQQEVPPVSTLQTRVQQEKDAGNDQLGVVLEDSSLGDAANSSTQPQRQLLGEQREDLTVGQQEKQQEVGQKTTQKGEPSPGEPGTVTAGGAGPVPRGSAEACLDPDHVYNVLFVGNSHVGKTSFLYRLHANTFNPHLTTTVGLDYQVTTLVVDNKCFALRLWDSAGTERYHSIAKQFFRKADGVVLMYDITSEHSFSDVWYWLSCIQEGAKDRVAILLLGNKTDCAAERQVPTKEGERLAKEHQLMFYECSAASGHNVSESMVGLIRLLKVHEDELKTEAEEVPKPPQKKKGCC
ncbi:PREDICTED: ras-related protein Rab-44 [Charadrius vociferus]|nr:PREDICTED: ras-related protein Rab-44 [Charadrius vociferus]